MNRTAAFALALLAIGLWPPVAEAQENSLLFRAFQDPPKTYSVRPFWFWNPKLQDRSGEKRPGPLSGATGPPAMPTT